MEECEPDDWLSGIQEVEIGWAVSFTGQTNLFSEQLLKLSIQISFVKCHPILLNPDAA